MSHQSIFERNSTEPRTLFEEKTIPPIISSTPTTPSKKDKGILDSVTTVSVSHYIQDSVTTTSNSTIMILPMERPSSPGNSSGSDNDTGINNTTPSTALRRLYFKSGRVARTKASSSFAPSTSALPKVIVMGSSTVSAAEINTSTESASTLITNVTITDTSEIGDSLDMGDISGLTEPLLNSLDDSNQTSTSISYDQEITTMELSDVNNRQDECLLEEFEEQESTLNLQISPISSVPQTAPICTSSVHFSFDPPSSPKSVKTTSKKTENIFTFKNTGNYLKEQHQQHQQHLQKCDEKNNINQLTLKEKHIDKQQNDLEKHHLYTQLRKVIDKGSRGTAWDWSLVNSKENKKRKETSSTEMNEITNNEMNHHHNHHYQFSNDEVSKKQKTNIKIINTLKSNNRYNNNSNKTSQKQDNITSTIGVVNNNKDDNFYKRKIFTFELSDYDQQNHKQQQYSDIEKSIKNSYNDNSENNYTDSKKSEKLNTDILQKYISDQNHTTTTNNSTIIDFQKSKKSDESFDNSDDVFSPKLSSDRRENFCATTSKKSTKEIRKKKICSKFYKSGGAGGDNKLKDNNPQMYNYNTKDESTNELTNHHHQRTASHINNFQSGSSPTSLPSNNIKSTDFIIRNNTGKNTINTLLFNDTRSNISALPDLRIDFFMETPSAQLNKSSAQQNDHQNELGNHNHELLENLYNGKKLTDVSKDINVTANPLETAICTQPRATIVVQQPSLSMDNTIETMLLNNENDFVSVEQSNESKTKEQQREENMRQLLDVTNTLSFQEIRDFEMRYGSPHHCRSQSVKTPGSRASGRPNQLSLPQQRSRVASMPNTGVEKEYYRLRHFSITGKGVVNRGDSLKSRRSRSITSVTSSNSSTDHLTANPTVLVPSISCKTSATCSLASSRDSSLSNPGKRPYTVLMLGGASVGKSSLVSQFMTSEYLHAYDTSIDDESGDKTVSVLLSGEESELVFIDHTSTEYTPQSCLTNYDPHGYCVIYSSADRCSFHVAETILQILWTTENIGQKAVILVANKADLARSRVVSYDEGKAMATAYDCKFIETSVGINHNVDELLVGLLTQIRLKLENPEKSRDLFRKRSSRRSKRRACSPLNGTTGCLAGNNETNSNTPVGQPNIFLTEIDKELASAHSSPRKYRGSSLKVKGLLERVWIRNSKSKSCENLHVL